MQQTLNGAGYDLYEISQDHWIFYVKGGTVYSGSFKKVIRHMAKELNFATNEINVAVEDMLEKETNAAHFGMFKSFMYSYKKELTSGQHTN